MNIPSVPVENIIDQNTKDISVNWRQFFDQLIKSLQTNASNEGLVSPSQPTSNITVIQNNQLANGSYTCGGGRFIYDSTLDVAKVSILNGGIPVFKTITVT